MHASSATCCLAGNVAVCQELAWMTCSGGGLRIVFRREPVSGLRLLAIRDLAAQDHVIERVERIPAAFMRGFVDGSRLRQGDCPIRRTGAVLGYSMQLVNALSGCSECIHRVEVLAQQTVFPVLPELVWG